LASATNHSQLSVATQRRCSSTAGDGNTVLLSSAGHERQKDLVRGWPATRAATTTSATIASHRCSVNDVSCCFGQASTRTMMPLHCRTRRHGAGVTAGADVTAWR
jgi:hypothetical protein